MLFAGTTKSCRRGRFQRVQNDVADSEQSDNSLSSPASCHLLGKPSKSKKQAASAERWSGKDGKERRGKLPTNVKKKKKNGYDVRKGRALVPTYEIDLEGQPTEDDDAEKPPCCSH